MRERKRVSIKFDQELKVTRGSFKDECDVNKIVERYVETGEVPVNRRGNPEYGEAPSQSLHEAACVQAELRSKAEEGAFDEQPEAEAEEMEKEPENGSQEPDEGGSAVAEGNEQD